MIPGPGPLLRPGRREVRIPQRVRAILRHAASPIAVAGRMSRFPAASCKGGFVRARSLAGRARPARRTGSRHCSGALPPGSGSAGSSGCRPSATALCRYITSVSSCARDAHADQEVVVLAGEQRRFLLDLADQADRILLAAQHLRRGSPARSPVWVNMWTMNRPPGSTKRAQPPMNRKLQAEKQAQPAGMRVVRLFCADEPAGLVADPGIAAGRAQPDLVDPGSSASAACSRGIRLSSITPFGEQDLARRSRSCDGEAHLAIARPVRAARAGRIVRIHRACAAPPRRASSASSAASDGEPARACGLDPDIAVRRRPPAHPLGRAASPRRRR